jgi:GMP synthase (glutamine-hydrolysing)
MQHEKILIIDYGSQFTQLIARRVREHGIYCEIKPCTAPENEISGFGAKGIILSGGPASVHEDFSPKLPASVLSAGVPVLGICYGEQLFCQALGGNVEPAHHREFGRAFVEVVTNNALFNGVWKKGDQKQVWMSHGDKISSIPEGFEVIAQTLSAPYAAIADDRRRIYGVQFHPEVMHTLEGGLLLRNFVRNICGCKGDWTMNSFLEEAIVKIHAQVGKGRVVCAVSGGVDSSVVAALLHKAIGGQLTCIFVDTGMLRENEALQVVKLFNDHFKIPLVHVDASKLFLNKLSGIKDPERKRKIIGETFIDVFEIEATKIGGADFLAQGTLYPDVIESVSFTGGPSVTIKSHHNVGGLPARMKMKLVEPVRELFKDEVRALGIQLGMPDTMVGRHPFPGPGLAIRVPGEITEEKLDLLRRADTIYIEEIRNAGLYDKIWQAFCVILPVKTVGVMGDMRTYEYVCALRAVTSTDGMTADYYPFDHEFLGRVATRIINEVRGINRIVYDVTSKPPGTIEWE